MSTDAAGTDAGDITVAQNVSWSTSNILQLSAHRNITINDGVTISNTHAGSGNPPILLLLVADRSGTGVGTVNFIGSGKVDFSQSSHGVFILYNPPLASSHVLTSPSSPGLYARMRVGDLSDLNGIVPDINSNPQTPLPPNTTRMTGGPGTPPSSALSTPILVASVERLAVPQDAFANGQQKVNFQSVIYTTVAGSTAASLLLDAALILPQTGSASPSSRRPAQWLIDDVRNAYASSPSDIKVIAQNAPYAFLAENAYSVPNVGDKIKVLGDSWEVVDVGGIRNGDPGMSATVFRNEKTREVVVAFRGTVNLEAGIEHDTDYGLVNGANINSLIVMQAAERFAELMQQKYGSVTFVGHSLGGAMAQYAAVTLGSNVNAVAFDSAPLGPSLLAGKLGVPSMTGVSANAVQSSGRSFAAQVLGKQYDNITNFRGPNDPVTSWASSFSGFITGDAAPQIGPAAIVIRNAPSAPASLLAPERTIDTIRFNHAMDNIANAAGAVRLAEPWLGAGR
ncbi:alpha/beta hydrolase [Candidatus Kaiserbacteria bacterium]|nr:alpha/beta hydrolase [Candidatus Kaiserbacteria bacterium]